MQDLIFSVLFEHLPLVKQYGETICSGEKLKWNGRYQWNILGKNKIPSEVSHLFFDFTRQNDRTIVVPFRFFTLKWEWNLDLTKSLHEDCVNLFVNRGFVVSKTSI